VTHIVVFILTEILPEVENKKQVMAARYIYQRAAMTVLLEDPAAERFALLLLLGTPGRIFKSV
jgi:hypothetical protein